MAKVSGGAIRLIDKDGDPLDDGNGRLNINATLEAASVNVGDVDIRVGGGAASANTGTVDAQTLRVTIANDDVLSLTSKAEDSAHSDGDRGIVTLSRRTIVPTASSGSDGDYSTFNTDQSGCLWVRPTTQFRPDTYAMIDVDNSSEQLSATIGSSTNCSEIFLQADEDNSGYVMVGDSDVADNRGMKLNPGDTLILTTDDNRAVYLWGSADNQNVRCMIMTEII